ncbi:MAG TPA: nicotinate phosphoribosyltransferase [Thermomicrobiales bacterium]|nr:nicotinate phosphoribosyltransferase [Thermomicrobiales bacterium]
MLRSFTSYHPGLLTDLYHPDAAYISWRTGRNGLTTFDLFARRAPFDSAFMLVAGIETALEFVREFHYSDEDLYFLSQIRDYDPAFLAELRDFRFSGEILALPEGSIAFANEPILRVTAPFREAILLESGLLQAINLATLIATKAARITYAARGRRVAEFALRRAQDPYVVARASFIGGCTSTSFLGAAFRFRLLATGSIPHALVQLFDTEEEAFMAVAESYNRYTLLLDTYDVRQAIHTAVDVARRAQQELGHSLAAVRLDSGDLVADSKYVRGVLDEAGLEEVRILISGDMDEFKIAALLDASAPVDAFGVGTSLGVGSGSVEHGVEGGALGGVYKEVWYEEGGIGEPKMKFAGEKTTWPGRKELYRIGAFERDVIALEHEPPPPGGQRLLKPVLRGGAMIPGSLPPVSEVWELAQANLRELPDRYRALVDPPAYPVEYSATLRALRDSVVRERQHPAEEAQPSTPALTGRDETADEA